MAMSKSVNRDNNFPPHLQESTETCDRGHTIYREPELRSDPCPACRRLRGERHTEKGGAK